MGKISIVSEMRNERPNVLVAHYVLVSVIPTNGDFQRLDRTHTTIVGDLVEHPGFASARSVNRVNGPELDGLEVRVLNTVDSQSHH
jgi:hypothetical protein